MHGQQHMKSSRLFNTFVMLHVQNTKPSPHSRVICVRLIVAELVNKLSLFYVKRRCLAMFEEPPQEQVNSVHSPHTLFR